MICIILVNYGGKTDTEECVKSIKLNDSEYKIIIVDNGSVDGKVVYNDVIDRQCCEIIYLDDNIGFAAGNNVGIEHAKKYNPEYVMLLNNDTVICEDCLSLLVEKAKEYNDQAVLTTKIVYHDDNDYIWYGGCEFNEDLGEYKIRGLRDKDRDDYNKELYVDYVTGCVMFIPINILEIVGKMSEEYFLYYEDADYCQRIKTCGYRMAYIPSITIYHKESRSTKRGSNLYHYYVLRNYLIYIRKYSNQKLRYILKKLYYSLKDALGKRMSFYVWICAWWDFLVKKTGKRKGLL